MDIKKPELYIPVQIRRRKEYFDGYGKTELRNTIISGCIGVAVGMVVYLYTKQILAIIIIITIFTSGAVVLTKKDKTNRSSLDYLLLDIKFSKSNKKYKYKYHNIHEKEVIKNDKKVVGK